MSKRKIEEIDSDSKRTKHFKKHKKFIHGNYSRYYGYRKADGSDPRLEIFERHKELFCSKDILDIGCNDGTVTLEIAKRFSVKFITGIDIDKELIGKAKKKLKSPHTNFLNVKFETGNYVLSSEADFAKEIPQFDVILCLSVTKWIHLNFGDEGIKMMFKRIYCQLKSEGVLILEAQPYESYRRRKKLSEITLKNYNNIKLFPKDFEFYLKTIGFSENYTINEVTSAKGFERPIQVFIKK